MKRKGILDRLYDEVSTVILSRQHPVTGLLPASTSINTHGDYTDAWVRDNVYSILCAWALSRGYKRFGETERCDQLEQSTVKLMRGLLTSMMRQAHKVERFKHTLDQLDSLHAKYDTTTGLEVVADDAWGHLQLDATSLYLLMLAQMTVSGIRIVNTFDEIDFVQNLVYYIASAYRTPDFGIWERGNKINNGKTEINASSVGMAKAALQALDGLNLFGKDASKRAIIHSVPDGISLARSTLAALLPRESLSKETDSALLSVIGFPAFAVGDKNLITKTRDDILGKLGGNYGCKRFLWDGHQTAIEESSRLYYEHSELAGFEHIESEWPLFFTYLYIHALFDGNETTAKHYREKIESLMVDVDGQKLLPELYYVPKENIDAEKNKPRSQERVPNENVPLVWAQSLYMVGLMLDEGLIVRDDLDPLHLRRRARQLTKTHIALVVIAENDEVKNYLAEQGVIAESLKEIQPISLVTAPNLVDIYTLVGANKRLGLTGRPHRRLQSLTTSQTYQINGKNYLSLSWMQSEEDDYRSYDAEYLADNVKREIAHIRTHWLNKEVAVFTWFVDKNFASTKKADVFTDTLRDLQLKTSVDHVGYASANLAMRASRVNQFLLDDYAIRPVDKQGVPDDCLAKFKNKETLDSRIRNIVECIEIESDVTNYRTLDAFLNQYSIDSDLGEGDQSCSISDLVKYVYTQAQVKCYWVLARFCYSVLGMFHIDLADGLTMLAARHLSLGIGKSKVNRIVIDAPMANEELIENIKKIYYSPLERTIVQEVLAAIGTVMRTEPRLFDGMRSIQVQDLMLLCAEASQDTTDIDMLLTLGAMSPAEITKKVRNILDAQHSMFNRGASASFSRIVDQGVSSAAVDTDWFEWRAARGSITRFDDEFLKAIWCSLAQAHTLVFGDRSSQEFVLDCEIVRSSMTAGEVSFANHIDELVQNIHPVYYKSAVIEALLAFTRICEKYPDSRFESPILFSQILEQAAKSYVWDEGVAELGKRDLDVLLEQSPWVLQKYVSEVLMNMATSLGTAEELVDE